MINRLEYYPLKSVIVVDLVKYFLASCAAIWLCYDIIVTPEKDFHTSIIILKWIFIFLGKKGIVIHHFMWSTIFLFYCLFTPMLLYVV